ncbi:acyltransferase family protein [Streptomyces sp. GQFP]|uniref:acyltransferase family protein n=1 Tax=Streptomyces sp. GQFP TaxID=2907545 RepID=UPI001F480B7B|nr:acyltransferase family protein [Streptomyces sp. GQFP]UIX31444.1 acyltransferase [Streptomyces sp. GQFP]
MTRHRSSAPESTERLRKYRPDIQGLRAVAIMMVVSMHCGILDIHGGVDVSFVLSGFLIGSQLLAEIDRTGKVSLTKFWARRFRRLAPGMTVVILVTAVLAWIYASPLRFRDTMEDGFASSLSVMNWRLVETGTDYFANDGTQSPYQHFWSLGIEEQFYLAAPIVLLVTAWLSRKIFRNRVLVGLFLITVVAGSLYLSITQTKSNQPLAYFGTQARIWELAFGILLALSAPLLSRMNRGFAAFVSWLGLATALGTALLITPETPLPGYAVAGPVLGASMIIAGGCAAPTFGVERLLDNPVLNSVANVSYGWYLWHWPILILWPDITGHELSYSDRFRVASLSLILAYAMYHIVEFRFRNNAQLVARPWKGVFAGGTAVTGTAGAAAFAMTILPLNLETVTSSSTVASGYSNRATVEDAAMQKRLSSTALASLRKSPDDHASKTCIDSTTDTRFDAEDACVLGDRDAEQTIVLMGDSHAWQWSDAFDEIGKDLAAKVLVMSKGGCSPQVYDINNPELNRKYTECNSWRESAFTALSELKPDVIVVSDRARREANREGAEALFEVLEKNGAQLVYLTDTPEPGQNIPDCLATHTDDVTACNRKESEALEFPKVRAMEQAVAEEHGAYIIDTVPVFCARDVCPAIIGEQVVYYDASHITSGYAKTVIPHLEPTLKKVLAG